MDPTLVATIKDIYAKQFPKRLFVPGETPIPVSGKVFDDQELQRMIEAVLDGHWTEGRFTKEFEQRLAHFIRTPYCATVNSGSSANLIALGALTSFRLPQETRLSRGDEVIVPATSFPTTVNPIIQFGLVPVFVDVELGSYNANPEVIMRAIGPNTKAIFMAHTMGNPYDAVALRTLCDANGLWLVEDNCDALGTQIGDQYTGTFGHLATCSFYPAHHITMGEGGAVFTNSGLLQRIVKSLRDWGRDCYCPTGKDNSCGKRFDWQLGDLPYGYDHKYIYSEIGFNLKITDMQAALGVAQLDKLPQFIERRKENFAYLLSAFQEFEEYFILPTWAAQANPSWFGFPLTIRPHAPFTRRDLLVFFEQRRIGTRLLFASNFLRQPAFTNYDISHRISGSLECADIIAERTFWLGVFPGLTTEMLAYITESMRDFLGKNR